MHCAWPGDHHSLGLTRIQLHSSKFTPLTNPAKVTDQGLRYCNSNTYGWDNSLQSRVISITDQLIFQNGKSSEVYRRNNNGPKTLPCGTPETTSTSLFRQPSTITCDRLLTLSTAALKSICTILLLPILQCTLQCMGHAQKCITGTIPFRLANWVVGAHHCVP